MGLLHSPESGYAKEMVKWEGRDSLMGPAGRPHEYRQFPMMLHRVGELPGGGIGIVEYETVGHVTTNKDGIPISATDDEPRRLQLYARGFRDTPLEALAAFEAAQVEVAKLAAEREYNKRHGLSARAVAEVEAVERDAGARHLPTIPERPIKRRGRSSKARA